MARSYKKKLWVDGGLIDNVVLSFSISTLIKELHSTNSRVYDAMIDNLGEWSESE